MFGVRLLGRWTRGRALSRPRAAGYTLLEMLTTVAALVIVLGLMVSLARDVRNRSADRVTKDLLRSLEVALAQYRQAYGDVPPVTPLLAAAPSPPSSAAAADEAPSEAALLARALENSLDLAEAIQAHAQATGAEPEGVPLPRASQQRLAIRDAWGGPVVLMPRQHPWVGMAAGDRPFFVSAGRDGQFLTRADNLYSYEAPTPERAASAASPGR